MTPEQRLELKEKYAYLMPADNFIIIKRIKEESDGIVKSGYSEAKAWGRIIATSARFVFEDGTMPEIGDLVSFNEFEGQELFKYGKVQEDDIIVLKSENILLKVIE